jgi:hypothetical protein
MGHCCYTMLIFPALLLGSVPLFSHSSVRSYDIGTGLVLLDFSVPMLHTRLRSVQF